MRVVESAFRSEVRAERRALTVAHPRVIVGLAAPVQLSDRGDPRSGGGQGRLIGGFRDNPAPFCGRRPPKFMKTGGIFKGPKRSRVLAPPLFLRLEPIPHAPPGTCNVPT